MTKWLQILTAQILVISLVSCGAAPNTISPSELPTQQPTAPPTPMPTPEPSCPEPIAGTQLLKNERMGYCFLHPDDVFRVDPYPAQVCLVYEVPALACHSLAAQIEVRDAGGGSTDQVAESLSPGVERANLTVAGQEAILVPEVHAQGTTREVMFVHDDRLYRLAFGLPEPEDAQGLERLERLFETVTGSFTLIPIPPSPAPAAPGFGEIGSAVVVFVKDGDIVVWEEATGQSDTIYDSGDVAQVRISDDGQLVAFVRRTLLADDPRYGRSALWIVDQDGTNPRELVSNEDLRALLGGSETDDVSFPGLEWIPNTHRLLYSINLFPARLEAQGLYLLDVDTLATAELIPAEESVLFAPSPDGEHIAVLHWPEPETPFFINVAESLSGQVRFIHPPSAPPSRAPLAWTQDSTAFLVRAYEVSGRVFSIWSLPVEGSPAQLVITQSGDREQLAPDGSVVTFVRGTGGFGPSERFFAPLPEGLGPLAVLPNPDGLSWSPGSSAYVVGKETMLPLCPHARQASEVCEPAVRFSEPVQSLHWLDRDRFLYLTYVPRRLMLGSLDGWAVVIAEDPHDPLSFDAVASTCSDDSEFVLDVTVPDGSAFAPDTVFQKTWRIRNTGTCVWDSPYRFTFLSGDRLSGPRSVPLGQVVLPGEEVELSVLLISPTSAGTYLGQWQLFAPNGTPFGTSPFVAIQVP